MQDLGPDDVVSPDYVFVTYAVCAYDEGSCLWGGWMLGAAFSRQIADPYYPEGYGVLPSVDLQICPRCGRGLFRTAVKVRLERLSGEIG